MIIASITDQQLPLNPALQLAILEADGVEICMESLNVDNLNELLKFRQNFFRSLLFSITDKNINNQQLSELAQMDPEDIALDYRVAKNILEKFKIQYPRIQLTGSYYNFEKTPQDLPTTFNEIQHPIFNNYKIMTMANSTLDALRMLSFLYHYSSVPFVSLTGLCLGLTGAATRILSPIVGNQRHYVEADQLSSYLTTYHFRRLNQSSKIYALLGDPVHLSVGHILHNQAIECLQENAVYLKLAISTADLATALAECRRLPFFGLSITMPLKEIIFPLVDHVDEKSKSMQAINSIVIHHQQLYGFNTDGLGAIQALSSANVQLDDLKHQTVVIIGAGGAARATAFVARQYQAKLVILNRTFTKAQQLAEAVDGKAFVLNHDLSLKNLKYNILINTLPEKVYAEGEINQIVAHNLLPGTIAMDIVYQPVQTLFLKNAAGAGCICIPGYEMYVQQALLQIKKWFNLDDERLAQIKKFMRDYFNGC